jgi:quinol monooxygenase YgiN
MEGRIMDSDRFDGLVRSFGQARSRRQALRGLAGVAAGASALALGVGTRAQEATPAASPEAEASPVSPMGTEIAWLPGWTVKPGALESVRALLEEMVTPARGEAGTLSYAVYVSEDGQTVTFYERYADEAAVLAHQARFGERFAERASGAAGRSAGTRSIAPQGSLPTLFADNGHFRHRRWPSQARTGKARTCFPVRALNT